MVPLAVYHRNACFLHQDVEQHHPLVLAKPECRCDLRVSTVGASPYALHPRVIARALLVGKVDGSETPPKNGRVMQGMLGLKSPDKNALVSQQVTEYYLSTSISSLTLPS